MPAMSVSEEERRRVFQENWDIGNGFRFMFGTFCDIVTDEDANEAAADFIRSKIAEIVEDPETARKLTPTDYYAKRPLCNKATTRRSTARTSPSSASRRTRSRRSPRTAC